MWAATMRVQPSFRSMALAEITDPDVTWVVVGVLPAHASADPAAWARQLFSTDGLPAPLRAVARLRELVAGPRVPHPAFRVRRTVGEEALVALDTGVGDLRVAVGVDEEQALVRVVAAVRLKGDRAGWLVAPLDALVPGLLRGSLTRSRRRMSGVTA